MSAAAARVSAEGVVGSDPGSALALDALRLAPGEEAQVGAPGPDTLLFVHAGEATLRREGDQHRLTPGAAALVPAGAAATLTAAADGAGLVHATIGYEGVELHAPMGNVERLVALDDVPPGQATGARSFQLLYGPHNGCVRATLFAGYIPPGRAPWHYHLYDEIVWILRGRGRLHLRDTGVEELGPGSAFRLRPREVHVVENLSAGEELVVLGLFTPAGSPSAAYLEPGVLAEYAIG